MQFLLELILQPVFEVVAYVLGYATAYVIVPLFTLGQVTVEPALGGVFAEPKRGWVQRSAKGKRVITPKFGVLIGVGFWVCVAVCVYLLQRA